MGKKLLSEHAPGTGKTEIFEPVAVGSSLLVRRKCEKGEKLGDGEKSPCKLKERDRFPRPTTQVYPSFSASSSSSLLLPSFPSLFVTNKLKVPFALIEKKESAPRTCLLPFP
jgi:hypothetical protein